MSTYLKKMKQLNKIQLFIYRLGGVLVIIGAMINPLESKLAPYIYSAGALMFASMQMLASYEGNSVVIRRLRRQQIFGALLLVVSGALMFGHQYHMTYMRHNEWLIALLIAAIFELYAAFRIPAELAKEEKRHPEGRKTPDGAPSGIG